jgi:hypothetical protein
VLYYITEKQKVVHHYDWDVQRRAAKPLRPFVRRVKTRFAGNVERTPRTRGMGKTGLVESVGKMMDSWADDSSDSDDDYCDDQCDRKELIVPWAERVFYYTEHGSIDTHPWDEGNNTFSHATKEQLDECLRVARLVCISCLGEADPLEDVKPRRFRHVIRIRNTGDTLRELRDHVGDIVVRCSGPYSLRTQYSRRDRTHSLVFERTCQCTEARRCFKAKPKTDAPAAAPKHALPRPDVAASNRFAVLAEQF